MSSEPSSNQRKPPQPVAVAQATQTVTDLGAVATKTKLYRRKHIEAARTGFTKAEVRTYDADTGELLDTMRVPTTLQEVVTADQRPKRRRVEPQ